MAAYEPRVDKLMSGISSLEQRLAKFEEAAAAAASGHEMTVAIEKGAAYLGEQKLRCEDDLKKRGSKSFAFALVTPDYYQTPLESRRAQLGAPSLHHLCKSIVMENTKCPHENFNDPLNSRYYMIMTQYTTKINGEKLQKAIRSVAVPKLSKSQVNMRLVDEEVSNKLTGFKHNGVAPFGCTERIPIILARSITELKPRDFWMGGGEIDVKLRLNVQEFIDITGALVLDITDDGADEDEL